jgi:hypothetical protein
MQSRKWNVNKDYSIIFNWCKQYNWDAVIPKEVLPKTGVIITDKEPICAAGLFVDKTSKLGFMWGIFSNPKINKIKLFRGMEMCIEQIENEAKKNKLSFVYTITGENALHKLYNRSNKLDLCENNINSYIMNFTKNKKIDWITNG